MQLIDNLSKYWHELYSDELENQLVDFVAEIELIKQNLAFPAHKDEWYKDAIIYSLYVDLFNTDFSGLTEKLDYLQDLGVNCLWLLPILDSPMKDAGFDIRNYDQIRVELLGLSENSSLEERQKLFRGFLEEARQRDLKVIFDIAINHTSDEHPWFQESRKSEDNPYRDYYIWSDNTELYKDARIIFKGLCDSNWEPFDQHFYFHRFFEFQPDLNFKNPQVLLEMSRNFLFWLSQGVDGFRADAIPYLWKEDGTTCENHPTTHTVVKFFRAIIDYVRPGTLLLAEACQKPKEVVKYFGEGNECNAGYHFPLMPQIFKSLASGEKVHVENILSEEVTPVIPESAQWFTFMRCHDELSLELVYVTEEDRKYIHDNYCLSPQWDFRLGQGVSARLSELMQRDPDRIALSFSLMLSLPGTPIVYYGDEFAKLNDQDYYKEMIKVSGKDDTRFLVRGKIDWATLQSDLEDKQSLSARVYDKVKTLLNTRKHFRAFGRGEIKWLNFLNRSNEMETGLLAYERNYQGENLLILQNLKDDLLEINIDKLELPGTTDLLGKKLRFSENGLRLLLPPYQYHWIDLNE